MAKILVIDDDAAVLTTVSQMLAADGHEVVTRADGNEGLAYIADTPVDLVLCDLIMPHKEGLETIRAMTQRRPGLRIVAMTGGGRSVSYNYLDAAMKFGATAGLKKPFDRAQLRQAIASCGLPAGGADDD